MLSYSPKRPSKGLFYGLVVLLQIHTIIATGSFANPASIARPRFRYWLPDASVDPKIVAADIAAAGAVGAGGIELVPFYEYGGQLGSMPLGANWSTFNFGTAPFRNLFLAALAAHEQHGLVMDFSLGPNQGQGVPAKSNDPGLQWDLVPFTATVPSNGQFTAKIPGWGTGTLLSLVSALVLSNMTINYEVIGLAGPMNVTYDQYILASESLLVQTKRVSKNGTTQLSFTPTTSEQHYRLFAFYEKLSGNRNVKFVSAVDNSLFDEGSYVVDHFDQKGAETVINFWNKYILDDKLREQLRKVGHYGWEDSPELTSNISWSRSVPSRFKDIFGYSILPYLPLLTFQENSLTTQTDSPGPFQCLLDTETQGSEHVNAFRAALTAGYQEYLRTLKRWINDELDLELSIQPGYGLPLDVQAAVSEVDVPECESLTFLDLIDSYRQFVGAAQLAGKQVISNELGAVSPSAFRYKLPQLLFSANRGFASGINQYIVHGQPYTGSYYQTTWPGHVPFDYLFSELWSPRQPVWDHGLKEVLDYISRIQHLQQSGIPKIDVVFYNKESATTIRTVYPSSDLISGGWSYNYLSPENLQSDKAVVENGILAPSGPAWKALAIGPTTNISLDGLVPLQRFADAGMPIIFVGESPQLYPTGNRTNTQLFRDRLSVLQSSRNVYSVGEGLLADKLSSLGLHPRVAVNTNGTWYTTWRESHGFSHALIYSDLFASEGQVEIADTRTPFFLDPWTGQQTPVLIYQQNNVSTTIPLRLAGNQTVLIAFLTNPDSSSAPSYHLTTSLPNIMGSKFDPRQGLTLQVASSPSDEEVVLSNGLACEVFASSIPSPFGLSNWTLVAEHWEAPLNISDAMGSITKYNTTHKLHPLQSWTQIPALVNTSGIGYYTTSFTWPPTGFTGNQSSLGAYLSFDNIVHALRVQINGHQLLPMDITSAKVDISSWINSGTNTVTAIVPSTWWNYLKTILANLKTAGVVPLPLVLSELLGVPLPLADENGLLPGVWVTPVRNTNC